MINISLPRESVAAFCQKYHIREMQLFGSVLRNDFGPDSDIDILVTFDKDARYSLFDLDRMQRELAAIAGRPIDLVDREAVETSANYIRRNRILGSAVPYYVA